MLPDLIVVTDLDASLLDHQDYSFEAATPAINRLLGLHIPLILNSSKTAAEIALIHNELGIGAPYIVENGAAVILSDNKNTEAYSFGMNRAEILKVIHGLRKTGGLQYVGFADMSADQVAEHTGLPLKKARLAMQREYTEPLLWQDSEEHLQAFHEDIDRAGLSLIRGGRFWHVSGNADKGRALDFLRDFYEQKNGRRPTVIALGDSENDLPMLEAADYPVLVRSPTRNFPQFRHKNLRKTDEYGPAGWNKAVLQLLEELQQA